MVAGGKAAGEIFRAHRSVTGIFASTFAIGMGTMRAAREAGIRIPADMSLIALHDSEIADYLSPALATIRLPVDEMARQAVDLLIELIDGGLARSVIVNTAPVLMARESIARPRLNSPSSSRGSSEGR
jgi:DNA-binding LacI/PurR family transcriptional regulator